MMNVIDFEYDSQNLSDYGFIVCSFDKSSGAEYKSAGSVITFNKVHRLNGRYVSTGTQYNDCITTTFDICKNPDLYDDLSINSDECRDIVRWLNRKEFLPFRLVDDDYESDLCYYDASFNIERIEIGAELFGLRLTMETDKPFGYGAEIKHRFDMIPDMEYTFKNISDEIGFIYPIVRVTARDSGNLLLENLNAGSSTLIKNVTAGEVIIIDGDTLQISSTSEAHKIFNDFNFDFPKVTNTYHDRVNTFVASLRCEIEITYRPIIKGFI